MSIITKFIRSIRRPSTKQLVCTGIFVLALAGSIGLGVASRGFGSATVYRDCDTNSIDYRPNNGGCGAIDGHELIADVRQNDPGDLQSFYAHFGLTPDRYDQFANTAQDGYVNRDGATVSVGNMIVMTNVDTYGRKSWGDSRRIAENIGGHIYYHAPPVVSFAPKAAALPAMVMFDSNGEVQAVVMNDCGNGVSGTPVHNSVTCHALKQSQPDAVHQPNTYTYTTDVAVAGNAQISRVVYHFTDDNTTVTKTGADAANQPVDHTFQKSGDVTVTVFASVPGNHEIQAAQVAECQKHVTYVPPFYVCSSLTPSALDDKKKSFRFTVHAKTDNTGQTVLRDADFLLDSKDATKGVTTKDQQGNIYKEYTFTDDVTHTVKATVNFNTVEGVQSVDCQASVTPAKTPKCTVPGHETEAPDSPLCGYCKPNIPIGDSRCVDTPPKQVLAASTTLVNTGPGSTAGLIGTFVGVATLGFFGHSLFLRRRMASRVNR